MSCFSCCCCCSSSSTGGDVALVTEQELQEIARLRRSDLGQATSPRNLVPNSSKKYNVSLVLNEQFSSGIQNKKNDSKVKVPQNKNRSHALPTIDEVTEDMAKLTFDDYNLPCFDEDTLKHIAEYLASDDPMENIAFLLLKQQGEEVVLASRNSHFYKFIGQIKERTFALNIDPIDEEMVKTAKTYFPNLQRLSLKLLGCKSNNFEKLPSFAKVHELTVRAANHLTIAGLENLMEFSTSRVKRFPQLERLIIAEANLLLRAPDDRHPGAQIQKRKFTPEMQRYGRRLFRKMRLLQVIETGSKENPHTIMREVSISSMQSISRSGKDPVILGPRRMLIHTVSDAKNEDDKDSPSFEGTVGRGRSQSTYAKSIQPKNALGFLMDGNLSEEASTNELFANDPPSLLTPLESGEAYSSSMLTSRLSQATHEPVIKEELTNQDDE